MEDKRWMGLPSHYSPQYLRGLKSFMEIVRDDMEARSKTTIYCLWLDYGNDKQYSDFEVVYGHLIVRGFLPNYTCWNKHREEGPNERVEWVADHQEGPNRRERQDGDQDGEEGNGDDGQAYDKECILECNEDQFDVLVDNVEDMICDVRREEDEMTEAQLHCTW